MGGKSDPKVYDYRASLDYALCYGPINALNYVWINDKRAYCGLVTGRRDLCINNPKLFGGDMKEGGIDGVIEVYMGTENDIASPSLARRKGFTNESDPDDPKFYQKAPVAPGIAHLFFRAAGAKASGFRWITNNYYLPAVKASVTRIPNQLGTKWATIRPLDAIYAEGKTPGMLDPDNYLPQSVEAGGTIKVPFNQLHRIRDNAGYGGLYPWNSLPKADNAIPLDNESGVCDLPYSTTGLISAAMQAMLDANGLPISNVMIPEAAIKSGKTRLIFELHLHNFRQGLLGGMGQPFASGGLRQWRGKLNSEGVMVPDTELPVSSHMVHGTNVRLIFNVHPEARFFSVITSGNDSWIWNSWTTDRTAIYWEYPLMKDVHCAIEDELGELPDANPAHDAYELLLDVMERDNTDMSQYIDAESFRACAKVLFEEGMGISYKTDQPIDRKALLEEISRHVKCSFFQSPTTGKWTMKLLRNDYVPANLTLITRDDCQIVTGKRRAWSQCVSEVVVEYTNPQEEKTATVSAFNDAAASIIGGRVVKTNSYPFFRNKAIAQIVADRDVMEESFPLWTGTLRLSRKFWQVVPGSVYRLTYQDEDHQIQNMVIRILAVDYGDTPDQGITVEVVEDIFSVGQTIYRAPQPAPPRPTSLPTNVGAPEYQMTFSFNYTQVEVAGLSENFTDDDYPYDVVGYMAGSINYRLDSVGLVKRDYVRQEQTVIGSVPGTRVILLGRALTWESYSTVPQDLIEAATEGYVQVGNFYLLSGSDPDVPINMRERETEIIQLDQYNPADRTWRVKRGCYDTVPRNWQPTALIWDMANVLGAYIITDDSHNVSNPLVETFGMVTSGTDQTDVFNAFKILLPNSNRQYRPTRPANVKVNGVGPEPYIITDLLSDVSELTVTWNTRNRQFEDPEVPGWDDDNILPEDGTTYTVRVRHTLDRTRILYEEDGITDTEVELPLTALAPMGSGIVEVWAVRDDIESFMASQNYVQIDKVALDYQGWDFMWGRNWNGTPI